MIIKGQKYLVTTDSWFIAPDGEQYRSVWGSCEILKIDEVIGFTPVRPSTNWYLKIGSEDRHVIVAGCQIHFAVRQEIRPIHKNQGKTFVKKNDDDLIVSADFTYYAE